MHEPLLVNMRQRLAYLFHQSEDCIGTRQIPAIERRPVDILLEEPNLAHPKPLALSS